MSRQSSLEGDQNERNGCGCNTVLEIGTSKQPIMHTKNSPKNYFLFRLCVPFVRNERMAENGLMWKQSKSFENRITVCNGLTKTISLRIQITGIIKMSENLSVEGPY